MHEEILRGPLSQARAHFEANPARGEITLVVGGQTARPSPWDEERLRQAILDGMADGVPPSRLAARLAAESGRARNEVYHLISKMK